jgi:hypothetical protein
VRCQHAPNVPGMIGPRKGEPKDESGTTD